MLLPHGTIVVLVDGERFELYRNAGRDLAPALERIEVPALDEHDKGAGVHHLSSGANPQGRLLDEDAHAAAVAEWLNGEAIGHRIEHLAVIAAPRTLGELRKGYHTLTRQALVCELDKDLIGRPPSEIAGALQAFEPN